MDCVHVCSVWVGEVAYHVEGGRVVGVLSKCSVSWMLGAADEDGAEEGEGMAGVGVGVWEIGVYWR